jgi:adenylate cyclase
LRNACVLLLAWSFSRLPHHSSIEAIEMTQAWRTAITRSLPGTLLLGCAIVTHVSLAFIKLARRSTWHMPLWELTQIATGLTIPYLLIPHLIGSRFTSSLFGSHDTYTLELAVLWPSRAPSQGTAVRVGT